MGEVTSNATLTGRFFKCISGNDSDWSANLVRSTDIAELPVSISSKKSKGKPIYVTVVGFSLPQEEYFDVIYKGEWIENLKYGMQFKVKSFQKCLPNTRKGIVKYLSSKTFRGIGKMTATLIVDQFGEETLNVIRDNPEKLLAIRGITKTKLKTIVSSYEQAESYNTLSVFLGMYGISPEKISIINKRWGSDAVKMIRSNPYIVCEIPGIGFQTAEVIARGIDDREILCSSERIKAAILYGLKQDTAVNGNVYSNAADLQRESLRLLNEDSKVQISVQSYNQAMTDLIKTRQTVIRSHTLVYSRQNDESEQKPAHKIIDLLSRKIEIDSKSLDRELTKNSTLSQKQKEAVRNSLMNRVSVITGGPGTGKTTILKCLIKIYEDIVKKPVTLLAPTGRAARRMSDSSGLQASTIHSAIHLYADDLPFGASVELDEGLIVVDEMSMVDQFLLDRMLRCVTSLNYQIVFVGDVDQLESVGAGSVLRELILSDTVPVTRLTEVFRQGEDSAIIVENANAINRGECLLKQSDRFTFSQVNNDEAALQTILDLYEKEVRVWGMDNVSILCPMRHRGLVCVDELNRKIQNLINPVKSGEPIYRLAGKEFRLRDRVIMTKNTEYASNGDIGVLNDIAFDKDEDGSTNTVFTISWDNGSEHSYEKEEMQDIDLAYAITIHKSQGSEYSSCIIPILSSQQFMLRRNLFYTAVTRCKERVNVVFDNRKAVQTAIIRNETGKRNTLFALRLKTYRAQKDKSN